MSVEWYRNDKPMKKHLLTTLTIVFIFLSCSNDPIIVDTSDVYTIEDVLRADYNFEPEEFKTFFRDTENLSEIFKDPPLNFGTIKIGTYLIIEYL